MKTHKNIFSQIIAFDNLLTAFFKAAKGKYNRNYVLNFFYDLEENLFCLQNELKTHTYRPQGYNTFYIYEPKKRMISAAPFRDRVVHHALINVVGPIIEKSYIYDSYANQQGKGTHRAIRRYQEYLRQFKYVLKCDIKKYFASIDHQILKERIKKKITDNKCLWLIETIIEHSNEQEFVADYYPGDDLFTPVNRRKGLPIGNLTSQYFANFYLNDFDHFVKEKLRCKGYIRYVDDMVLFGDSKISLQKWLCDIICYIESLRLKFKPSSIMVYPSNIGTSFLGQVIFKDYRRLKGKNVRAFCKRVKMWQNCPPKNLDQRIASWRGHAQQADTVQLRKRLHHQFYSLKIKLIDTKI